MPGALVGRADRRNAPRSESNRAEAVDRLWRQYKTYGGEGLRTRLVSHYMEHHVRRLAERLHATLPGVVDLDDLVQEGYLGLAESIERFELDRDVRFETFSARRIFGSMRDYLRAIDPAPRLARARAKQMAAVVEDHRKQHGRPPSDRELCRRMRLNATKFRTLMSSMLTAAQVHYSGAHPEIDAEDDGDAMHTLPDQHRATPLSKAEHDDMRRWITKGFSRRDHLIIILYYYEHLTMREVGQALGISESRVSQRLDSIIKQLRARLSYRGAQEEFG